MATTSSQPDIRLPGPGRPIVEVDGLDLRAVGPELAATLRRLAYEHQIVAVHGQDPEDVDAYLAFARALGTPEPYFQAHYHHPEHPEVFVSSNVPLDGKKVGVAGTGRMWHCDYSFFERPLAFTMIRPIVLPRAHRETLFIDMRRVLDELPDALRGRIEGRRCLHDAWDYYKVQPKDIDRAIRELIDEWHEAAPGAVHPAIVTHPATGQRNLFVSRGFTKRVVDLPEEESDALLEELFDFCEQERFVHHQPWAEGDILYWDNRSLIHHASTVPKGESSCSFRISLYDDLPFSRA